MFSLGLGQLFIHSSFITPKQHDTFVCFVWCFLLTLAASVSKKHTTKHTKVFKCHFVTLLLYSLCYLFADVYRIFRCANKDK